MEELHYWIALSMIDDIGPVTAKRLIGVFGGAEQVFGADIKDLKEIDGIGEKRARAIKAFKDWKNPEEIIKRCRNLRISLITYNESAYPENLKTIADPPLVLYIIGQPLPQDNYALAIVGSRKMSDYGRRVTERLSRELAELGITVVSGLARGIDITAHSGALKAGGRTIGVFGSGLDRPYPPESRSLLERIKQRGYIISEFPPGTPPNKENFPKRNRLISGLSLGVVVVEAEKESGALITATLSLEQGREVFSIPGSIFSKTSEGTNNLIKSGAKLVTSVDDIIEELAPRLRGLQISKGPNKEGDINHLEFTDKEKDIIEMLSTEPVHIDDLSRKTGLAVKELACLLLQLELKGIVKQMPGKRFYI